MIDEPSDEIVNALIKALSDKDVQVRRSAASVFWQKPDKKAIPALIKVIEDRDEQVRLYTVGCIGYAGTSCSRSCPNIGRRFNEKSLSH